METSVDPEIVALLPEQGAWSERDYLWLTDHISRPVEYADGYIEVLPTPTDSHQAILQYLLYAWHALLMEIGGVVRCAPLRLRLPSGRYREPDLLILRSAKDPRRANAWWEGADLVVEIVSPDDPERDYVTKRQEYAQTGIPEYWIVDPERERIDDPATEGGKLYRTQRRRPGRDRHIGVVPGLRRGCQRGAGCRVTCASRPVRNAANAPSSANYRW